jgi:hypothetical protein
MKKGPSNNSRQKKKSQHQWKTFKIKFLQPHSDCTENGKNLLGNYRKHLFGKRENQNLQVQVNCFEIKYLNVDSEDKRIWF